MNHVLTIRTVMRQEAQRQRQKSRAATALARARAALAPPCDCAICTARRRGEVLSLGEVISRALGEAAEAVESPVVDAGDRRH